MRSYNYLIILPYENVYCYVKIILLYYLYCCVYVYFKTINFKHRGTFFLKVPFKKLFTEKISFKEKKSHFHRKDQIIYIAKENENK